MSSWKFREPGGEVGMENKEKWLPYGSLWFPEAHQQQDRAASQRWRNEYKPGEKEELNQIQTYAGMVAHVFSTCRGRQVFMSSRKSWST